MIEVRQFITLYCFLFSSLFTMGQEGVTTVGFQFKPIIANSIVGGGPFSVSEGVNRVEVSPKNGNAFGMVVRRGFTKNISGEFGINRVVRRFEYVYSESDTGFEDQLDYNYLNYEIPVKGIVFVQLGEELFLNNSLGFSFDLYASDVASGDVFFEQVTLRKRWLEFAMEAGIGMEFRTKKSGYFYLGGTYHNPFHEVARSRIKHRSDTEERDLTFELKAGYLTIDLKYYFSEPKQR